MRSIPLALAAVCALCGIAGVAHADRVVLVGGEVLEGKATRQGDKITVEVEAGQISVPAEAVARIERSESLVSQFDARYAALRPGDVQGRLNLADYCRDHGMRAREHKLLLEVLEVDRDNAQARARLGYVKTDTGWVTEADAMRAKGLVQYEGRWVTPAESLDLERRREDARAADRRREAEADLEAKRAQVAADRAELDREQSRIEAARAATALTYPSYYAPVYPAPFATFGAPFGTVERCPGSFGCRRFVRVAPAPGPFDTTTLSVVKVPYRHH